MATCASASWYHIHIHKEEIENAPMMRLRTHQGEARTERNGMYLRKNRNMAQTTKNHQNCGASLQWCTTQSNVKICPE